MTNHSKPLAIALFLGLSTPATAETDIQPEVCEYYLTSRKLFMDKGLTLVFAGLNTDGSATQLWVEMDGVDWVMLNSAQDGIACSRKYGSGYNIGGESVPSE